MRAEPAGGRGVRYDGRVRDGDGWGDIIVGATGWLCGRYTWTEVGRNPRPTARRVTSIRKRGLERQTRDTLKGVISTCDKIGPATQEAHRQAIREVIARDKNHPCVVLWTIANEPDNSFEDGQFTILLP